MPPKKAKPAVKSSKPVSKPAKTVAKPVVKKTPTLAKAPVVKMVPKPVAKAPVAENYFYANGKRKTSIARVRIIPSNENKILVNARPFEQYFTMPYHQMNIRSPFKITATDGKFNVTVDVSGGGINSQSDAIRHGIAKALLEFDQGLRLTLKRAGFLTRDSRVKERKKPGLHRARRGPQFSKR